MRDSWILGWFLVNVTFAICYRPSVCRLSVCNVRAPYSGGSNFRQYFCGIRYLYLDEMLLIVGSQCDGSVSVSCWACWLVCLLQVDRVRRRVYCRFEDNITHWCYFSNIQRLSMFVCLLFAIFHFLLFFFFLGSHLHWKMQPFCGSQKNASTAGREWLTLVEFETLHTCCVWLYCF